MGRYSLGTYYVGYLHYYFYTDGKFQYFDTILPAEKVEGKYSVSNGKVYFKEVKFYSCSFNQASENAKFGTNYPKWKFDKGPYQWKDMTTEYKFGSDKEGNYLQITTPRNYDPPTSYTLSSADKFYKK